LIYVCAHRESKLKPNNRLG